jgi:hypothetical protein
LNTRSSHRWSYLPGNWDPLNTELRLPSQNLLGIPDLAPSQTIPTTLIPYGNRRAAQAAGEGAALHFFLDDYRIEPLWRKPTRLEYYLPHVESVLTPDFSLYRDMPHAAQLWNVYRSRWIGALLSHAGIDVIPTVSWSGPSSFSLAQKEAKEMTENRQPRTENHP